jgi:subtilisin family serine protease
MKKLFLSRRNENRNRTMLMTFSDKLALMLLTASFSLSPLVGGEALAQDASRARPSFGVQSQNREFAPDRVIVKYSSAAPERGIVPPGTDIGSEIIKHLSIINADVVKVPLDWTVEQTIEWYREQPGVEYAEPDYLQFPIEAIPPATTPDDPRFDELWGLNNTAQTGGTADADIDAPEAWDLTTGDSTIIVGVIDTGTDISHTDLVANIWINRDEVADDGIDNDNNGYIDDVNGWDFHNDDNSVYDPADGDTHATHVSGTIGALASNTVGVTGIAWKVKMMPLKFLGAGGGFTSNAITAIQYAIDNGAKMTTNSWGGGGFSQALKDAIDASGTAGMLFMAAAGNSGQDADINPHYPAGYTSDNIVSVAATDHNDGIASFSTYGLTTVDLGAPGVSILSTLPDNTYGSYNGTSMATPHVTGVAVLVYSAFPSLTHQEVKARLMAAGDPIDALSGKTVSGKRLNAYNVLEEDSIPPNAVTNLAVGPDPAGTVTPLAATQKTLEWTAPGDDGATGTANSYDLRYATTPITDDSLFTAALQATGSPRPSSPGSSESGTVSGLNPDTEYYFALKTADNVGNYSPLSNSVMGKTSAVLVQFEDDAETAGSDTLWTADLPWARTDASASPDGGEGQLSGSYSWTDSPDGNYGNGVDASLTSIAFSLADAKNSVLTFDHKYAIESGWDYGYVDITKDGGATWTELAVYSGTQTAWTSASFDIGAYDNETSVQVRFHFTTDGSVTYDGWYVDDIRVISDVNAAMKLSVSLNATNDTALVTVDLENEMKVAGASYGIKWDDAGDLLAHNSSSLTDRSTGFTHSVEVNAEGDSLSAILVETGGSRIPGGTGAIAEYRFVVRDDLLNTGGASATAQAPAGGASAGLPTVFFEVPFSLGRLAVSDSLGNPVFIGDRSGGSIKIDLLSADVDFSGVVDLTDVVSTLDHSIGRTPLTDLQVVIADTYLDQEINVVDVVRGINIILGRQIGTGSALAGPRLTASQEQNPSEPGRNLDVTLRPNARSAGTQAENLTDLVADIPSDVVGLQVSIEYDPSRGRVSNARLLLNDDEFEMVQHVGTSSANFLIYSPTNTPLPAETLPLIALEFESEGPSSIGSSASPFQLTQILGVNAAGTPVYPGINPMLAVQELLGTPLLDNAQKSQLDRRGNRDGVYNLGDLLALLHRSGLLPEDVGPDAWRTPLQGPRR